MVNLMNQQNLIIHKYFNLAPHKAFAVTVAKIKIKIISDVVVNKCPCVCEPVLCLAK